MDLETNSTTTTTIGLGIVFGYVLGYIYGRTIYWPTIYGRTDIYIYIYIWQTKMAIERLSQ